MKPAIIILTLLLLILQYKLWFGDRGLHDAHLLNMTVQEQQQENIKLKQRNEQLSAEVKDLKEGNEAIEERARSELGMIKKGETFYQIVEEE